MKYLLFSILTIILISGCSSKKYFEPEEVNSDLNIKKEDISSSIKSMNRDGATLEDGRIITRDGVSSFKLPEGYEFLNAAIDGRIIATNYKDKLLIGNDEIEVKDVVVAASIKDNKLALVYSNNTIELYDLAEKKTLFKEYQSLSLANDTRIANPYFMGNLALFPTLDGKVIIVSTISNESVKNISVDPDGEFNNIIFLKVIEPLQTLIVASPNKIVSISPKEILAKNYELRDILLHNEDVYVATIDGNVIKLTPNLEEVAKKKFKYSKIHSLVFTDSLYAIESQGYAINLNEDFSKNEVYKFNFDNEERLISIKDKVYNDGKAITLP